MGSFQSRLVVAAASAYVCQYGYAFQFDMSSYMKLQAMRRQFDTDSIDRDQQRALMQVAGFGDMELFMSKQISAADLKESLKAEYKDKIIGDIMQGGGIDISNPLWRRKFFDDKTDAELFTESLPEPMQTIIRLTKDNNAEAKAYGKKLLKTVQYRKLNKDGNVMTENIDEILMSEDKTATIKNLLKQQMLEQIADPLDRAMMYLMQQSQASNDQAEKDKLKFDLTELQKIKIFQGQVPEVSPVSSDDLYAFHMLASDPLNEADILNAALGEDLKGVSELDFERYFGSPAKQFSCRSHPNRLRVPCGINPTSDECLASGCCFNPTEDNSVPSCYHDLYGKIGSAILRRQFIEDNAEREASISGLFRDGEIPTLKSLFRDDYNSIVSQVPRPYEVPNAGQINWWDAAKVDGENGVEANLIQQQTGPRYGRPGYKWRAHGPTASPYLERYPGINPTAAPGGRGGLDEYYQMWLSYTDTQDQVECALINPNSRVKCMENYEAIIDKVNTDAAKAVDPNARSQCQSAGCCFNEDSFLEGNHACYRASDYGTCTQLPGNFVKSECGYDGISEGECLTNARCCYEPTHITGEPWCYYKYSATLEENEWCDAWNLIENRQKERQPCWNPKKGNLFSGDNMSDINNLVSREQCLEAGCCYDEELTQNALDWIVEGLGQTTNMYRCFEKTNPALVENPSKDIGQEYKEINRSKDGEGNDLADPKTWNKRSKTCIVADWEEPNLFKRSCGENLSYYQCVYVNKCCYKATVTNEPTCFKPEYRL